MLAYLQFHLPADYPLGPLPALGLTREKLYGAVTACQDCRPGANDWGRDICGSARDEFDELEDARDAEDAEDLDDSDDPRVAGR